MHSQYLFLLNGLVFTLTATANDDFSTSETLLVLVPLATPYCTTAINIVNDEAVEETESLIVALSLVKEQSRIHLSQPTATIFIFDDDGEICIIVLKESPHNVHVCSMETYKHIRIYRVNP